MDRARDLALAKVAKIIDFSQAWSFATASKIKVEAGKLFHSAAGHVPSGESYAQSAIRELNEECGVKVDSVKLLGYFWFEQDYPTRSEKERFEIFEAKYSESMGPIKLNKEQVDEKWLSLTELKKIFTNQPDKVSGPLKLTCKFIFNFEPKS